MLCGNRSPQSPPAELARFKIMLSLVWLYLHSRTEVRRHTTNHLFHTALEGAHHHNCNNNYHSLRVCGASRQAPARQPEDALLRKLFLQLLTPPTEDTNGGPTG